MNEKEVKEIIEMLPNWFKKEYLIELAGWKEAGRYWIRAEDVFKVISELKTKKK